jgi:hypothetical protein
MLAAAAALMLLIAAPLTAHAEDAPPPVDPPPVDVPPVVMPPIPSEPYVPPPPLPPAGSFTPPPEIGGTGTTPVPVWDGPPPPGTLLPQFGVPFTSYTCYYATPDSCAPMPNGPMMLSEAQIIAMVAKTNSGSGQWDIQMGPDGTLQMRPFGSSEPWTSVGAPGLKRIAGFPPPGTTKTMWDVFALLDEHQLKHLDPIEKQLTPP